VILLASSTVRAPEQTPPRTRGTNGRARNSQATPAPPAPVLPDEDDDLETTTVDQLREERAASGATYRGKDEDFFDWLTQFTTDDWQFMMGYLYRTAPTIDRRAAGRPTNIRKYSVPFDQDTVMHDEGSGGYRLDLCRRDPSTGRSTRIAQHYFQIMNLDYPPRVPAGDWIDQPENDVWKWAAPKIAAAAQMAAIFPQGTPADPNKVFDTVLAGVERLRGAGNNGGDNVAAAAITALSNMTTKMMEQASTKGGEDPASKMMLTFLQDELRETRKEMRELRDARRNEEKPKGILEQLKDLAPVVTELKSFFGLKGDKTAPTNWGDVITEVIDKLSDNAPLIYDMVRGPRGEGSPAAAQWRLDTTKPKAAAAETPAGAGAQTAAPAPETPAGEGDGEMPAEQKKHFQAVLTKWGQLITNVAPFLVDHFRANLSGYEFRDWFISRQGVNNYSAFRLDVTAADLTELAQLHQTLRVMLQPREKLLIFLTEFMTEPGNEPPGTVSEDPPAETGG
jgi:hypothetical protein